MVYLTFLDVKIFLQPSSAPCRRSFRTYATALIAASNRCCALYIEEAFYPLSEFIPLVPKSVCWSYLTTAPCVLSCRSFMK